jgi:hypothetical protein
MKTVISEEPDQMNVECDASKKLIFATWESLVGPQVRKAIDAAASSHVSKHGITTWIADVSQARDVPTQDDLCLAQPFDAKIEPHSFQRLINVLPQSAIVRLGAAQRSKNARKRTATGTYDVDSMADALELAA